MSTDKAWQFIAELVRQLDAGESATSGTVAASLDIDRSEAEDLHRALRRRGLIEELPGPRRLSDSLLDRRLEVTPEGIGAAASGRIQE